MGCLLHQKKRIQKVLNFGARVVSGLSRRDHVTPVLNELGWKCVDDLIRDSDVAVVSRLLTSDSAPQILRSKLVLSSDESARTTLRPSGDSYVCRGSEPSSADVDFCFAPASTGTNPQERANSRCGRLVSVPAVFYPDVFSHVYDVVTTKPK